MATFPGGLAAGLLNSLTSYSQGKMLGQRQRTHDTQTEQDRQRQAMRDLLAQQLLRAQIARAQQPGNLDPNSPDALQNRNAAEIARTQELHRLGLDRASQSPQTTPYQQYEMGRQRTQDQRQQEADLYKEIQGVANYLAQQYPQTDTRFLAEELKRRYPKAVLSRLTGIAAMAKGGPPDTTPAGGAVLLPGAFSLQGIPPKP